MDRKVTIYTQAYNTKPYLEQCIQSVLGQTYGNFEWILVDNGCTDGSSEIMKKYAEKDNRIRLIRYEENQRGVRYKLSEEYATGDYFTILDSDDWWESDYLERLIETAEEADVDIVSTGTLFHDEKGFRIGARKTERRVILDRKQYAEGFPLYHQFFRAQWAKLIRMEIYMDAKTMSSMKEILKLGLPYGGDTLNAFAWLREAKRICLDDSVLYHYHLHKKSVSHQYKPKRFDSDTYLYEDAIRFLSAYGLVSERNQCFLQCVYANAVSDTLGVLGSSSLSPVEKLHECRIIACHPLTIDAYQKQTDASVIRSRSILLELSLWAGSKVHDPENDDLNIIMRELLPRCGKAVNGKNAALFFKNRELRERLFRDEPGSVLELLLTFIAQNRYMKKYPLSETVRVLTEDNPLTKEIAEPAFLQCYGKIYLAVWRKQYLSALESMTGFLLEGKISIEKEAFLQLYLSLAALKSQDAAFLFGKFQMSWFYLEQGRLEECGQLIKELEEMGISADNSEEFAQLTREYESEKQK